MRRFRFRLERLLALKAFKEREWQTRLAEITGACVRLAIRIKEIEMEANLGFKRRFQSGEGLDLLLLQARERYQARLESERGRLEEELEVKTAKRVEVQKKFLEASKERKVLEKLKERKESEYYAEQRAEEFKSLNEVTSSLIAISRNQNEAGEEDYTKF